MADRIISAYKGKAPIKFVNLGRFELWANNALFLPWQGDIATWIYDDGETQWQCLVAKSSQTLILSERLKCGYALVAAAGGGASRHGGGGGAGQVINKLDIPTNFEPGNYPVTIGLGGQGAEAGEFTSGNPGQPSSFLGDTALGGGCGGGSASKPPCIDGGNGGGGRQWRSYFGLGDFNGAPSSGSRSGGGGGGADGHGSGHNGGQGLDLRPYIGASQFDSGWLAGGGAGGGDQSGAQGIGGIGGGGNGGSSSLPPSPGKYGSGGGAGGRTSGGADRPGENGGGGLLILRYPIANPPAYWLN